MLTTLVVSHSALIAALDEWAGMHMAGQLAYPPGAPSSVIVGSAAVYLHETLQQHGAFEYVPATLESTDPAGAPAQPLAGATDDPPPRRIFRPFRSAYQPQSAVTVTGEAGAPVAAVAEQPAEAPAGDGATQPAAVGESTAAGGESLF